MKVKVRNSTKSSIFAAYLGPETNPHTLHDRVKVLIAANATQTKHRPLVEILPGTTRLLGEPDKALPVKIVKRGFFRLHMVAGDAETTIFVTGYLH